MDRASKIIFGTIWRPKEVLSKEKRMIQDDDDDLSQNRPSYGKFYGAQDSDYAPTFNELYRTNTRWSFHNKDGYGFALTNQTMFNRFAPMGPQDIDRFNDDKDYAMNFSMIIQRNRDYELMEKNMTEGIFRFWAACMETYDENLCLFIRLWVGSFKMERDEPYILENSRFDEELLKCLPYDIEHNMFIVQNWECKAWNYLDRLKLHYDIGEPISLEVSCTAMTEALQESWLFLDNTKRAIEILINDKLIRKRCAPPSETDIDTIIDPYRAKDGREDPLRSFVFYKKYLRPKYESFNYEESMEISNDGVNYTSHFAKDTDLNEVNALRKTFVKCFVMPDCWVKFISTMNCLARRINVQLILSKTESNYANEIGKENIDRLYIHSFRRMHPYHEEISDAAFRFQKGTVDGLVRKSREYVCDLYEMLPLLPKGGLPLQFRVLNIFGDDYKNEEGIVDNPVDIAVINCWETEDVYALKEKEWDEKWEEENRLAKLYYEKNRNKDQEERPMIMNVDDYKELNPQAYRNLVNEMQGIQVEGDGEAPEEGQETAIVPR